MDLGSRAGTVHYIKCPIFNKKNYKTCNETGKLSINRRKHSPNKLFLMSHLADRDINATIKNMFKELKEMMFKNKGKNDDNNEIENITFFQKQWAGFLFSSLLPHLILT